MSPDRQWPRWLFVVLLAALVVAALLIGLRGLWSQFLFDVTGEEALAGQVRGGLEWLGNLTRPSPDTADWVPVANAGQNPYGVNTFLEQEVEPEKRDRAVQMIADAGFHWIRQEFSWEDIEIHGKGDFQDRRNDPYRSAWEKYDQIVDLAEEYDLEIIARLSNPPAWSRAKGDEGGAFAPPDSLKDYGDFVEKVVRRYGDRIHYWQIWNEPNIYPEWGDQPVDPEAYTELLKTGHSRVKAICPDCTVISGALAQTIPLGPRDLNDFIFLQRMYDAGAADYFDVLAMQGYGLWSGPTDRRMRPRVLNFSRPLYLREIMVQNGDAAKPIWITEMNWNAPAEDLPNKQFGVATEEQQARYAVLAYQRAQEEWPWVGVVNAWFFKRATDTEQDQAMYYFRLVEPDFTPLPVFDALKEHMHQPPVLFPGVHQEDHWALTYAGPWETREDLAAQLGSSRAAASSGSVLNFTFSGTDLRLKAGPGSDGSVAYSIDGAAEREIELATGDEAQLAQDLPAGTHDVTVRVISGRPAIDSLAVAQELPVTVWIAIGGVVLAVALAAVLVSGAIARRRRWFEHGRAPR